MPKKPTLPPPEDLPEAVREYLSARGRIAGAAGTGKSKRRSAAHYRRIAQAAAEARAARKQELERLRVEVEELKAEVRRLKAKLREG